MLRTNRFPENWCQHMQKKKKKKKKDVNVTHQQPSIQEEVDDRGTVLHSKCMPVSGFA